VYFGVLEDFTLIGLINVDISVFAGAIHMSNS
jgi:hypothetical protein